ncbi:MAG: DUF6456 domain-containing protein, partial [Pseudomonadota bacterium]
AQASGSPQVVLLGGRIDLKGQGHARSRNAEVSQMRLEPRLVRDWDRMGWVTPSECGRGLRLSEGGRRHLKRLMSRGGGNDDNVAQTVSTMGQVRSQTNAASRSGTVRQAAIGSADGSRKPQLVGAGDDCSLRRLQRLRQPNGQPLLSAGEYSAGERLHADFVAGQMDAKTTMSWGPTSGTAGKGSWHDHEMSVGERALAARERVRHALRAVGPDFSGALFDVCCLDVGITDVEARYDWPRRSGKVVMRLALRALGRHYGFVKDA